MKLRHLFMINFFIALFFGASCALMPNFVFSVYKLSTNEAGIWTCRLLGGALLGFATLFWFGTKTPLREARRAVAYALLFSDVIGFLASLEIQLNSRINLGWINLVLYGLLASGYAYFLLLRPKDS